MALTATISSNLRLPSLILFILSQPALHHLTRRPLPASHAAAAARCRLPAPPTCLPPCLLTLCTLLPCPSTLSTGGMGV